MKKQALFGFVLLVGMSACQNAADKIKSDQDKVSTTAEAASQPAQPNQPEQQVKPQDVSAEGNAEFNFAKEVHDFGEIQEGEVVTYDFEFENTGEDPLIITNAQGSCGCTVPQWPREPIAPGESGKIQVAFNSSGKKGSQNKTVTLTANTTPNKKILRIKGMVKGKEGEGEEGAENS